MKDKVFLCVGGDKRQVYMCRALSAQGKVCALGLPGEDETFEAIDDLTEMDLKADVLVLPFMPQEGDIPLSGGGAISLSQLCGMTADGGIVIGGRLTDEHRAVISSFGLDCADYYENESLTLKNCVPTAEGTLMTAMQNTDRTIAGSRVLVTGFGRTAKVCASLFKAVGAEVTVTARRTDAGAEARTMGLGFIPLYSVKARLNGYDIIINTVPALILTEDLLEAVSREALIIDIASKPGGTDFHAAERLGIRAVHALALPGRCAPVTAGEIIAETVIDILHERGK